MTSYCDDNVIIKSNEHLLKQKYHQNNHNQYQYQQQQNKLIIYKDKPTLYATIDLMQIPLSPPPSASVTTPSPSFISSSSSSLLQSSVFEKTKMNENMAKKSDNELLLASNDNDDDDTTISDLPKWSNISVYSWSREEVNSWLEWCTREYSLSDIPFNRFQMNGKALCMFSEDMFKQRVPNSGDILYKALQNLIEKDKQNSKLTQLETFNNGNKTTTTTVIPSSTLTNNDTTSNMLSTSDTKPLISSNKIAQLIQSTNNNSDNEDCSNNNSKLIIDENSNNSENSSNFNNNNNNKLKRKNTLDNDLITVNNHGKKRTKNLANVIGNIINRKLVSTPLFNSSSLLVQSLNQSSSSYLTSNNGSYEDSICQNNNNYNAFSNPLSPSASSTSSIISQSSNNDNSTNKKKSHTTTHPKQRWIMESETDKKGPVLMHNADNGTTHETKYYDAGSADSANGTASPSSSMRCDQDSDILKEHMSTPVSSCASDNGHPLSPVNAHPYNDCNASANNLILNNNSSYSNSRAKNQQAATRQLNKAQQQIRANANEKIQGINIEDPTRQIKFYDDFIDFRGDILKRPPGAKNCRILWEYLYILLQDNAYNAVIRWEDQSQMVFRIVQAEKLAALWGLQKNRLGMTYEKLSRGMRYYYPNNIIAREPGRRLLYRFMRHPDEIKKSVKKNGTYMLKRGKMAIKNKKNIGNNQKNLDDDNDCEDDNIVDEDEVEEHEANNEDDDSGLDEAPVVSPVSDKKKNQPSNDINKNQINGNSNSHSEKTLIQQKLSEKVKSLRNSQINGNHNNNSNVALNGTNHQITSVQNSNGNSNGNYHVNAAAAAVAHRLYPIFYPHLTAQMAACAAALQQQQQQQPSGTTNFFQRSVNNDDVLAAQFLMQLRNQNSNEMQQLAAFNGGSNGLLNLQQLLSNSNDTLLTRTTLPIKNSYKAGKASKFDDMHETSIKQEILDNHVNKRNSHNIDENDDNELVANNNNNKRQRLNNTLDEQINIKIECDDNSNDSNNKKLNFDVKIKLPTQKINNKLQSELPLNLCKRRKLILKKEKSTDNHDIDVENQENSNNNNDDHNNNQIELVDNSE